MGEPRRLDVSPSNEADVARENQAETLLVEGLDHYFANRYEDAIHLWTRVLFLDRSHARARAYIDRARTAVAERQRQSEELLHESQVLLDRGQTVEARSLLAEAVATTGEDERASAVRLRLERLERASAPRLAGLSIGSAPEVVPGWAWPRRSPTAVVVIALGAVAVLVLLMLTSPVVRQWTVGSTGEILAESAVPAPLPVLSSSDVALLRARTLYGRGRLAEALQALERVDEGSAIRSDADALRIEIQRLLLASSQDQSRALRQGTGR